MRFALRGLLAALVWTLLTLPPMLFAKGGGGHGGGHSGGGGHSSTGHASSSHSRGSGAHTATSRTAAAPNTPSAGSGHTRTNQPITGSGVPRSAVVPPTSSVGTLVVVPAHVGIYGGFGSSFFFDPFLLWGPFGSFYSASVPIDVAGDVSAFSPFATSGPSGGLRLQTGEKDAQVFVDGYYAGVVDDFDGPFQHVNLRPGPHHVEIRAFGFDPLGFDVYIVERHTTSYRGTLTPR